MPYPAGTRACIFEVETHAGAYGLGMPPFESNVVTQHRWTSHKWHPTLIQHTTSNMTR